MTTDALRDFCKGVDTYERILKDSPDPLKKEEFNVDTKTIDDIMYDEEVKKYSLAFD